MVVPLPRRLLTLSFELSTANFAAALAGNTCGHRSQLSMWPRRIQPQRCAKARAADPTDQVVLGGGTAPPAAVGVPATAAGVRDHSSESSPLTTNPLTARRSPDRHGAGPRCPSRPPASCRPCDAVC